MKIRMQQQQKQRMELFKSVVVFCSDVLCVSIEKAVKPLYIHAEKMEVSGTLLLDTAAG